MTSIWEAFSSFYFKEDSWTIWDPTFERAKEASEDQIFDLERQAKDYALPLEIIEKLNELITTEVQKKLARTTIDNDFLKREGFKVMSTGGTHILQHEALPKYLIKVSRNERRIYNIDGHYKGQTRTIKHMNLLRAPGRERFASEDPFFVLPEEHIYQNSHATDEAPLHHRFYAVSVMQDVYTPEESLHKVNSMSKEKQIATAKKIIQFIKHTGLVDIHKGNFLYSKKEDHFVVTDLEPLGVMIERHDSADSLLTFEQRVLLGLLYFRDAYCLSEAKNSIMAKEADNALEDYLNEHKEIVCINQGISLTSSPKWELIAKIVLSIFLPFIPLLVFIWACLYVYGSNPSLDEKAFVEIGHLPT